MFEFGLGVILAALFVAAYLLITSFFRRDRDELGGLHPAVSLNPVDTSRALDAGQSKRALTSGESSERNSGSVKEISSDDSGSKR